MEKSQKTKKEILIALVEEAFYLAEQGLSWGRIQDELFSDENLPDFSDINNETSEALEGFINGLAVLTEEHIKLKHHNKLT